MDAITAYLHGDVNEDIFMKQPEGFADGTTKVCKLNKAIYGLKQAGRLWNVKLDGSLMKFGLKKSKLDPCIYFDNNTDIIVAIYVDDFLILYKSSEKLNEIKKYLNNLFRMKDIGEITGCLGIRINQGKDFITLDQEQYINEIL